MKSKAVSGIMLMLLLIGMLALAFNIQTVEAEPLPVVSLNPIEYTAWLGESFMIDVYITDIIDMKGCAVMLGYDNALLEAVRVYPTDITDDTTIWLPVDETLTFYWDDHPTINNTRTYAPGYSYVWVAAWGFTSFTGNGAVFTIRFTAIATGNCTLDLFTTHFGPDEVEVLDSMADPIEHEVVDGSVTVVQSPPVGGKATPINIPMNEPETPTLWILLTTIILSLAVTVVYVKKRREVQRLTLEQTIKEPVEYIMFLP